MSKEILPPSLPILYTTGTYYDVGFEVGSFFADKIKSFLQKSKYMQDLIVPYAATEKGQAFLQDTLKVCQNNFPQHVKELEGIAAGSGIPFPDIFLLNVRKEIGNVLVLEETGGCTDIMINAPHTKLLAHNEDCDPFNGPYGYLVNARIVEDGVEVEHFTAYCYPGSLTGTCFAFNKHGMVFTVDGLYTNYIVHNAPPRVFLNRAVIRAQNVDEACTILKNEGYGSAYGFCTNICDMKYPSKMWSIELGPQKQESLLHVQTIEEETDPEKPCHYIHYNKFEHLQLPSHFQHSSTAREKRFNQMPTPRTKQDILNILGDTTDELYPLFRSERPSDPVQTVFTSVVDILQNRVEFYRGNPSKAGAVPLFHLRIHD